jgi:Holliday junction DNA helicase RuvA
LPFAGNSHGRTFKQVEEEMIAGLKGIIEAIGNNFIIIGVGGVSFQVYLPTSTLSHLGAVGQPAKLHTHLHVREDNLTLYGFGSARELALFQTVTTVKGIGPKLGLALLSAMDVEQVTSAIAGGDAARLTGVPGIGKKTAERIVLELKDKIGTQWMISQDSETAQGNSDIMAALNSLGYSSAEAARAISNLPNTVLPIEEKLKLALKFLSEK